MSITQKKKTLRWNAKVLNVFQIYTFFDSGFSTLIEYRNDFKFSEDFCTKSLCKLTCLKPLEISMLDLPLYKYPVVTSFVSFLHFMGTKIIIRYSFFVYKTVGWVDIGHHLESLRLQPRHG